MELLYFPLAAFCYHERVLDALNNPFVFDLVHSSADVLYYCQSL